MADEDRQHGPIVLCILDGWGLAATWRGNAIAFAETPHFTRLWRTYPHAALETSDRDRDPRLISSELQHATIGAGRWIRTDVEELDDAVASGFLAQNPILINALRAAVAGGRALHLLTVLSLSSLDTKMTHLAALLKMANNEGVKRVEIHLIIDTAPGFPSETRKLVEQTNDALRRLPIGAVATLVGSDEALATSGTWERTLRVYRLWVSAQGEHVTDLDDALRNLRRRGFTDRSLPPLVVKRTPAFSGIADRDAVIVLGGQGSRLVRLVRAFLDPRALRPLIRRQAPLRHLTKFVTLVAPEGFNHENLDVAFPPANVPTTLPELVAERGGRQLRIGPATKELALTRFFSGGRAIPYPGEERHFLALRGQSLPVELDTLSRSVIREIDGGRYHLIVANLDAVDRVAHTGDLFATAAAATAVDRALGSLTQAVLLRHGTLLVTADHGNAEAMLPNSILRNRHTPHPVPFILAAAGHERNLMRQAITLPANLAATLARPTGNLTDVAPTVLHLLGIPVPVEMTGRALVVESRK